MVKKYVIQSLVMLAVVAGLSVAVWAVAGKNCPMQAEGQAQPQCDKQQNDCSHQQPESQQPQCPHKQQSEDDQAGCQGQHACGGEQKTQCPKEQPSGEQAPPAAAEETGTEEVQTCPFH